MLKKILISLGVFAVAIMLTLAYLNHKNRTLSPPGRVGYKNGDFKITVDYSRPSVRNRLIFGAAADGALQPYGSYWRLGANEATEITINKDVLFGGEKLSAGTYRLYAVPGAASFKIGVNSELGQWGLEEPNYTNDIFVLDVPVTHLDEPVEQLTVRIEKDAAQDVLLFFEWSDVQIIIPIRAL